MCEELCQYTVVTLYVCIELDDLDAELDDLDMDEDVPDYMVSAASAATTKKMQDQDASADVDEYGLPKVAEKQLN